MTFKLSSIISGSSTLGIEITDLQVKICEIKRRGENVTVTAFLSSPLTEGTMNDGRIQDITALQQTIQKMLAARKWKTRNVHFAIPSQNVMIRMMKLPNIPRKQLEKLISFEMRNNIHLPFENPYYDFTVTRQSGIVKSKKSSFTSNNENDTLLAATADSNFTNLLLGDSSALESPPDDKDSTCDVMLIAAPIELLNQYKDLFRELDLKLVSMEIKSLSVQRTLEFCRSDVEDDIIMIVDVNETSCDLSIIENKAIKITRNVQTSFAGHSGSPISNRDELFSTYTNPEHDFELLCNDLIAEIERLINFYRYTLNNHNRQVDVIYISGDIEKFGKFLEIIGPRMTQPIITFNSSELVISPGVNDWNLNAFAVPFGLSLRGRHD